MTDYDRRADDARAEYEADCLRERIEELEGAVERHHEVNRTLSRQLREASQHHEEEVVRWSRELGAMTEKLRWRSVEEGLPDHREAVETFDPESSNELVVARFDGKRWYTDLDEYFEPTPTHWRPIDPPAEVWLVSLDDMQGM